MEDAHIAYKDEINDIYVFGVFDGHGGYHEILITFSVLFGNLLQKTF
jgi:hypothetical protein